ncbi:MAG: DUF3800 domain-containing protein [Candidatus Falkowbacteria bacterium]|nr:DUF3800 domain-containing protein [Candidatus Falkowbacteria bacterium]
MTYIFMDESGDMGFSDKSSKWFLFTLAIIGNDKAMEKVIKKVWKTIHKKHKHLGELHASNEKVETILKTLRLLSEIDDLKIVTIILNKKKVYLDLQEQKNYLYNYTANIVLDRLINTNILDKNEHISLIVDRKDTKKNLRENFISYITKAMYRRDHKKFKMTLISSHDNKCLQAVDFISWAIFRKYERGDFEFYEVIKNKIIDEKLLFP